MKYKIISARNIGDLERLVNVALAQRWKPCGGIGAWGGGMMIMQAMVQ
jgi:hypothetical protein